MAMCQRKDPVTCGCEYCKVLSIEPVEVKNERLYALTIRTIISNINDAIDYADSAKKQNILIGIRNILEAIEE